jgi:hypothetical protein
MNKKPKTEWPIGTLMEPLWERGPSMLDLERELADLNNEWLKQILKDADGSDE